MYSEKDAIHYPSVMSYSVCDVVNRVMTKISGCDVRGIVYMWPYIMVVVSYIEAVML